MSAPELYRRSIELRLADEQPAKETNRVRLIASTDAPVGADGWEEVLLHGAENVAVKGAKTLLLNHDRNQLIGRLVEIRADGHALLVEAEIAPEAKTATGVPVLAAVRSGALSGVSIGYNYRDKDTTTVKEGDLTRVTVNRWQLREVSLTPTPADLDAQVVRAMPGGGKGVACRDVPPAVNATAGGGPAGGGTMAGTVADPVAPVAQEGDELAQERAAHLKTKNELERTRFEQGVQDLARTHGLELNADELAGVRSIPDAVALLTKKKAAAEAAKTDVRDTVVVVRDGEDKLREAATDGVLHALGQAGASDKDLGLRRGSVLQIGMEFLTKQGVNPFNLTRLELARRLLQRDAANVTSGMFTTYVLANAFSKAIQRGFGEYREATYPIWTVRREVPDFKTFYGGALSSGNLQKTTENVAFPEIGKAEYGYSAALEMWGATLSLTLQALINDDLGEFMRILDRVGPIAQRTIDKQVYTALAAATWTSRTATGDLAADTLNAARQAIEETQDSNGEALGVPAKFLLVPAGLRATAIPLVVPPQYPASVVVNADLQVVSTPFLTTAGTASQSTWYLAADNRVWDTVIVAFLNGMTTPQVEEYDAGAVAARKWKVYLPFKVAIPTDLLGMYRKTHS